MKNKVIIIISVILILIVTIGIILNITLSNKSDIVDTYDINESATTDITVDNNVIGEVDQDYDFQVDTVHMSNLNENIAKDIYDLGIETFESNNVTLDKLMSTNWDYVETCNAYRTVIYSGKTGIAISYIPGEGFETLSVNSME